METPFLSYRSNSSYPRTAATQNTNMVGFDFVNAFLAMSECERSPNVQLRLGRAARNART
jgi:hypothetical protein